jgi:hypothetical protein
VDDLNLRVGSQIQTGTGPVYVISSLAFPLEFVVGTDGGPQTITLRYSLPSGLSFTTAPSAAEGCQAGPPVVCQLSPVTNEAGSMEWRKTWGVQAAAPGTYEVTATVEGARPDPNTTNNTHTFRFEVRSSGSSGGGVGGGSVSVAAGAVKLTPARPKAGSVVLATASVTADGDPVKPSKVSCTGTLAGKKVAGKGMAATGKASCRYATPKSAKGKSLAGSMAITAKGKTITRRFSARLA